MDGTTPAKSLNLYAVQGIKDVGGGRCLLIQTRNYVFIKEIRGTRMMDVDGYGDTEIMILILF